MLCLHYALCRSRSVDRAPLTPLALFTVVSDACKIVSMYPYNTPANTVQHRPPHHYSTLLSPELLQHSTFPEAFIRATHELTTRRYPPVYRSRFACGRRGRRSWSATHMLGYKGLSGPGFSRCHFPRRFPPTFGWPAQAFLGAI